MTRPIVLLCTLCLPLISGAQQTPAPSPQGPPPGFTEAPPPPPTAYNLNWVPTGLQELAQASTWHTDFTFDHSMLSLASNISGLDPATKEAVARLNGISVHSFRFKAPANYQISTLDEIRAQYDSLGWKHLVSKASHGANPQELTGQTDVWISNKGPNLAGGAVLIANADNVNLIVISGDISTLDLLHLRGHFGIPRFSGDGLTH